MHSTARQIISAVQVPWNAFVGVFLYYTLLAVVALSGFSPDLPVVATAYAAPLVAWAVFVSARLLRHAARPAAYRQAPQTVAIQPLANAAR